MNTIPIRIIIFGTLKFLVNISIQCPNTSNCLGSGIIMRQGRDLSHSQRPYRYKCQECNKRFYVHTSRQFRKFNNQQQELIMNRIAKCGSRVKDIAREFNISTSTASNLAERYRRYLEKNIIKSRTFRVNHFKRRGIRGRTVFIDETYRKINGKQFYLILAVDGSSSVLTWKLTRARNHQVLQLMFEVIFELRPNLEVIVTDGFRAYLKALRLLPISYQIIYVMHIHKRPRGLVRIRYLQRSEEMKICLEYTLNTTTRLFNSGNTSFLAISQLRMMKFRMKSIKNPLKYHSTHVARKNSIFIKRLNKIYKNNYRRPHTLAGSSIYLFEQITLEISVSWTLNNGQPQDRSVISINPILQNSVLQSSLILQMTHVIMKLSTVFIRKSITSNRVEGKFGNFDLSVPVSGRKNFVSYQNMVDCWLQPSISFDDYSQSSIYATRNLNKAVQISVLN